MRSDLILTSSLRGKPLCPCLSAQTHSRASQVWLPSLWPCFQGAGLPSAYSSCAGSQASISVNISLLYHMEEEMLKRITDLLATTATQQVTEDQDHI